MNNILIEKLRIANQDTYKIFSLKGLITYGKIINNYDGDTADCILIFNDNIIRYKVRFFGYDSPEIKPPLNIQNRDDIKKKAIEAKTKLWKLCSGLDDINEKYHETLIKIVCDDFDKYGRLLINAYDFNCNNLTFENSINKKMIDEGFGYSYFGGKKII